jgi:phosphotransferase system enzyme I (PtsP)
MKAASPDFSDLLQKASGVQDFLLKAVERLADLVGADACSLFLLDHQSQKLILRATVGLNPEAVGRISLSLDEGLVGLALRERRVVRETEPARNPQFKLFPEVREEQYRSFLALPLLKGPSPLGVLTLHDREPRGFEEAQVSHLRDLASGLGAALGDAQMLYDLAQAPEPRGGIPGEPAPAKADLIRGRSSGEGVALGTAVLLGDGPGSSLLVLPPDLRFHSDKASFRQALERSLDQVETLQAETEKTLSDVASLIFSTHLLMLKDESFSGAMEALVDAGLPAAEAVVRVVNQYVEILGKSPSALLKEKVQDVKDLGHRLLRNLSRENHQEGDYTGQVVVAEELLPSELVKIAAQNAEGVLLFGGGATAHVSILAKSLGIPVLFTEDRALFTIREGDFLVLDGFQGTAYVNPAPPVVTQFRSLAEHARQAATVAASVHEHTKTTDGQFVRLLANINLLSDLPVAKQLKAEGVGLYRSEFPFIIRNDFPTEEEQYKVYRRLIEEMGGQEVVLRTLDIGGDKVLSYMPQSSESNPFLGLRAIRFSLRNIAIFHEQLRAMLRAGHGHQLRILFPLISSLDDFREAKGHVEDCVRQLAEAGIPHNGHPLVGAMVELPSACEVASELARESDFLSVGTNDLVQYLLGVDRTNEAVQSLYNARHPAVYRTLQRVIRAAVNHDTPISICGELAADPHMIPFLLGAGIRKLSINPKLLPQVQRFIEGLSLRQCQVHAEKLVQMGSVAEIHSYLGIAAPSKSS